MHCCFWSEYGRNKDVIDETLEIINSKEFTERFYGYFYMVASEAFSSISTAKGYLAECLSKNFVPWVALFAEVKVK